LVQTFLVFLATGFAESCAGAGEAADAGAGAGAGAAACCAHVGELERPASAAEKNNKVTSANDRDMATPGP
jgi:hypothetical protein